MLNRELTGSNNANTGCHFADTQIIKYIREQRHDFMNHIQVIWGYLQLNKPQEARAYIEEMNGQFNTFGCLFKLDNPVLSLVLYECFTQAYKLGMEIDMEVDIKDEDIVMNRDFSPYSNMIIRAFDEVINRTEKGDKHTTIYVDISDEEETLYLVFSNSPDIDLNQTTETELVKAFVNNIGTMEEAQGMEVSCRIEDNEITVKLGF